MFSIAICDDEAAFRKHIQEYLHKYQQYRHLHFHTVEAQSGQQLLNIADNSLDIIFLDIKMKQMDGMQTARRLREKNHHVQIIFMTSAPEYALEGYKVNAFDYLVKPVNYRSFCEMMDHLLKRLARESDCLRIKNNDSINKIYISSIIYIETFQRNLLIHTPETNYISHEKLGIMEKKLADKGFFRCNSGYLVNLAFVDQLDRQENLLHLSSGDCISVSRPRKKDCIQALSEY